MLANDKIQIRYGEYAGWETYHYIISFQKGITVREFIEEQLKDKHEWGYFGIVDKTITERTIENYSDNVFGNPRCEYESGRIKGNPLPDDVLSKEIISVKGSGGWSRSDFLFEV